VAKITPAPTSDVDNPTPSSVIEPKSMPRIDITPRYRDTGPMSTKISSFTNDAG
jgi:hypothetical protein